MIDFSKIMSAASRQRIDAVRAEMDRLYTLQDRWLAEELLRLSRDARQLMETHFPTGHVGYDQFMVNDIAPEIARRLGGKLNADEAQNTAIRSSSDRELRENLGHYFNNQQVGTKGYELRRMMKDAGKEAPVFYALDIIGHEFVNGNPLAMAMDRICDPAPAGEDKDDWLARHTREISRNRGFEPTGSWSPDMQGRAVKPEPEPEPEDDFVIEPDF
jgi:hypothetical protein